MLLRIYCCISIIVHGLCRIFLKSCLSYCKQHLGLWHNCCNSGWEPSPQEQPPDEVFFFATWRSLALVTISSHPISLWWSYQEDTIIHCLFLEDSNFSSQKSSQQPEFRLEQDFKVWSPGWSGLLNYLKIVIDIILEDNKCNMNNKLEL